MGSGPTFASRLEAILQQEANSFDQGFVKLFFGAIQQPPSPKDPIDPNNNESDSERKESEAESSDDEEEEESTEEEKRKIFQLIDYNMKSRDKEVPSTKIQRLQKQPLGHSFGLLPADTNKTEFEVFMDRVKLSPWSLRHPFTKITRKLSTMDSIEEDSAIAT